MQLAGLKVLQNSWRNLPIADQKPSQLIVIVRCGWRVNMEGAV
jgi:hypothetical protein